MPITIAYRAEQVDSEGCCSSESQPNYAFCARPCSCRKLSYWLMPKEEETDTVLRIAVLSDVEENEEVFSRFIESAREREVDLFVNIGDLTASGGQRAIENMADFINESVNEVDGEDCLSSDERQCCEAGQRDHEDLCNTLTSQQVFTSGLGANETSEESFYAFFENFGPTNTSSNIGGVQLVMLDSADGTISNAQFNWLEEVLATPKPQNQACDLYEMPEGLADWPLLGDPESCPDGECDACLYGTAGSSLSLCVPPPADRADTSLGPLNCMCIPRQANPCPKNFQCVETEEGGRCQCSRDTDCGPGFRCNDGACEPPLRIFFTHTPPFDVLGARNRAFLSRREAARLVALLVKQDVGLVFAGGINSYSKVSIGSIPTFITGGGGAELEAFDETGHHWILITIPDVFTKPNISQVGVELVPL